MDFLYDDTIGDYNSISILHALFDGYLQPNLGNDSRKSLKFFRDMLSFPKFENTHANKIVANSFDIIRIYPMTVILIPPRRPTQPFEFPSDFLKESQYQLDPTRKTPLTVRHRESIESLRDKIYPDLYKTDWNRWMSTILSDIVDVLVKFVPQEIYPEESIVVSGSIREHLISFYYKKKPDGNYDYGFFNSGDGIEFHDSNNDGKKSVAKFFTGNREDFVKMRVYVYIFSMLLNVSKTSPMPSSSIFYKFLPKSKTQLDYYPPSLEKMRWIYMQLSGTCTYFGFLYAIKYIFYSNEGEELFDEFEDHIRSISIDSLLTYVHKSRNIGQKHKMFLDMLASQKSIFEDARYTDRIKNLYWEYEKEVSYSKIVREPLRIMDSPVFYQLENKQYNFADMLPTLSPEILLETSTETFFKIFSVLEKKMDECLAIRKRHRFFLSRYGVFLLINHIVRYLQKTASLPTSVYNSMSIEEISRIPKILYDMYIKCQCVVSSYIKSPTDSHYFSSKFVHFFFRIIMIRVNEANSYCYFIKSSKYYDHNTLLNYFYYLIDDNSTEIYEKMISHESSHAHLFHLLRNYYDIIFSDSSIRKTHDPNDPIVLNILDYSSYLSADIQKLSTRFETKDKFINSDLFFIFVIMGPLRIDEAVCKSKFEESTNRKLEISVTKHHIYMGNVTEHKYSEYVVSSNEEILNIVQIFSDDTLSRLNTIYTEKTFFMRDGKSGFSFRCPISIPFNLEKTDDSTVSLESVSISMHNGTTVKIPIVADYVKKSRMHTDFLSFFSKKEVIEKMFQVLNDVAIIVVLNVVVSYKHVVFSREILDTILKHCETRTVSSNKYSLLYKTVCLIVSDTITYDYETEVVDYVKTYLEKRRDSSYYKSEYKKNIKNGSDEIFTESTIMFFIMELYTTYIANISDVELFQHSMKFQTYSVNQSGINVVEKYQKMFPDSEIHSVVSTEDSISFTAKNSLGRDSMRILRENPRKHQPKKENDILMESFLWRKYGNKYLLGLTNNENLGTITFRPHVENPKEYKMFRHLRLKKGEHIQLVKMLEISPDKQFIKKYLISERFVNANDTFYLDGIHFYKEGLHSSDVYVEFGNFRSSSTHCPLLIKITSYDRLFYIDDVTLDEHLICTESVPYLVNMWIYGVPLSFVYRSGLFYRIVYVDSPLSRGNFDMTYILSKRWWIGKKAIEAVRDVKFLKSFKKRSVTHFHTAQIEYHGLGVIFSTTESMRSYLLTCVMFTKPECLDPLLPKYLSRIEDKRNDIVVRLLKIGYTNNPYSHHFTNSVVRNPLISIIMPASKIRSDRGIYGNKYSVRGSKISNSSHVDLGLDKYAGWFDKISLEDKYRDVIQNVVETVRKHISKNRSGRVEDKLNSIVDSVNFFSSRYHTCISKQEVDTLPLLLKNLVESYDEIFVSLGRHTNTVLDLTNMATDELIIKYDSVFYSLLEIKTVYGVVEDLINMSSENVSECMELKSVYDKINTAVIYLGERTTEMKLFEILFGWYIRKDQYEVYADIVKSIDSEEKVSYLVHQLLMGRGKSSVVMPLLMFHYTYSNPRTDVNSVFMVLPQHLTTSTLNLIFDKFYPILTKTFVSRVVIDRLDNSLLAKQQFRLFRMNITNNKDHQKVFIVSDTSYKSLKMNTSVVVKKDTELIRRRLREQSVTIFDEFDNQYDPTTSDLNFPIDRDTLKNRPIIDVFIQHIFTDFIIEHINILNDKLTDKEAQTLFTDYVSRSESADIRKMSLYIDGKFRATSLDEYRKSCITYHMFKQLIQCKNMIYNKDYGFPSGVSHSEKMKYFAVPYSAVDTPVKSSEFSDTDISLLLTIFVYAKHEIRILDIRRVIAKLKKSSSIFRGMSDKDIDRVFEFEKEILQIKSIAEIKYLAGELLNTCSQKILETIGKHDPTFKKFYIKTEILPKIKFTYSQNNCSFMDVITREMCLYKAAFSGTVYLDLPTYENTDRVFVGVHSDKQSTGATFAALLGCYHEKRLIHQLPFHIKDAENPDTMLDYLIELVKQNSYQVLIDSGAYLRLNKSTDVVKKIQEKLGKKYVIYIDSDDVVRISHGDQDIPYLEQTGFYKTEDLFIYYDNKHIIGTDIKQPYRLSGLVTVSPFNNIVDISQATFRMRNLNYGHTADFITSEIPNAETNVQLVLHLYDAVYDKIEGAMKIKKLEQEIKSRYRMFLDTQYATNTYHLENVFNKYTLFSKQETFATYSQESPDTTVKKMLEKHLLLNWMKDTKPEPTVKVSDLFTKLETKLKDELPIVVNKNREVEKSREMDKNKEIEKQKNVNVSRDRKTKQYTLYSSDWEENILFSMYLTVGGWIKQRSQIAFGSLEKIPQPVLYVQNISKIYWSPLIKYYDYCAQDAWTVLSMDIRENPEYPEYYRQLLDSSSSYYIKFIVDQTDGAEESYLIITQQECFMLLSFVKLNPHLLNPHETLWIKDKNGNIVYGPSKKFSVSAKELFVRLISGKILTIEENFIMISYLKTSTYLHDYLKIVNVHYKIPLYETEMYTRHIETDTTKYKSMLEEALQDPKSENHYAFLFGSFRTPEIVASKKNEILSDYFHTVLKRIYPLYADIDKIGEKLENVSEFLVEPLRLDLLSNTRGDMSGGALIEKLKRKIKKYKHRYSMLKGSMH